MGAFDTTWCQTDHAHDGSEGACYQASGARTPAPPARLRILPIYNRRDAEPSHYVIIDRCSQVPVEQIEQAGEKLRSAVPVPVLIFAFEVELPDVDDLDYADGDEELITPQPARVGLDGVNDF